MDSYDNDELLLVLDDDLFFLDDLGGYNDVLASLQSESDCS